jgi:hypothetical protein
MYILPAYVGGGGAMMCTVHTILFPFCRPVRNFIALLFFLVPQRSFKQHEDMYIDKQCCCCCGKAWRPTWLHPIQPAKNVNSCAYVAQVLRIINKGKNLLG